MRLCPNPVHLLDKVRTPTTAAGFSSRIMALHLRLFGSGGPEAAFAADRVAELGGLLKDRD